jgi:casein kinase II subunit beta
LIHARYVYSPRGQAKILKKFLGAGYGYCPRTLCDKQKVLPVGISDIPRTSRFKVFCPRCEEVYIPKCRTNNVDGACFGTSFPHAFLKSFPNLVILPPKVYLYEPKISGFKIYGKRGSKFHQPLTENGTVRLTENDVPPSNELEARDLKVKKAIQAALQSQAKRPPSPVKKS